MKEFILFLLISYCFVTSNHKVFAQELPQTEEGFLEWVREKFGEVQLGDEIVQSANFIKGKVVDQNGNPIEGVEIKTSWFYTSILTLQG